MDWVLNLSLAFIQLKRQIAEEHGEYKMPEKWSAGLPQTNMVQLRWPPSPSGAQIDAQADNITANDNFPVQKIYL
jgi:hypothetical protein